MNKKSKDGSLSAHIYDQTIAGAIRLIAQKKGIKPQKLLHEILKEYVEKHIEVK